MGDIDFDTSLVLYSWAFNEMKRLNKDLEMRRNRRGIEVDYIIRFMKGYNPENGALFRRVNDVYNKHVDDLTATEIDRLALQNKYQAKNYADDEAWFFSLGEIK